jgi:hypothetical protein
MSHKATHSFEKTSTEVGTEFYTNILLYFTPGISALHPAFRLKRISPSYYSGSIIAGILLDLAHEVELQVEIDIYWRDRKYE